MNDRGKLFFGGIIVVVFFAVLLGLANSSRPSGSTQALRGDPKYSVTVKAESVGLEYIVVTNENTDSTVHILPQYLPMTVNFAANDILTFTVYSKEKYVFNAWSLSDGTFESANPLSIKPAKSFEMNALFMPSSIVGDSEVSLCVK